MEKVRKNYPIAGKLQHGEKQEGKRVKELGYFIVKSKNSNMQFLLNKFNEKYPQQKKINIRFFDENPFSIRFARYNQGGNVCYCLEESIQAKEKTKNGWKSIECKEDCQYRAFNGTSRPACNREGTLKFLIPGVSTDRIFIMKITGQTSIDRISDYITLQKIQGKSIIGDYVLTLNQEEQLNRDGKIFNNYVLDIYKNEEIISQEIPQTNQITVPTENKEKVVKPKEEIKVIKEDNKKQSTDTTKGKKETKVNTKISNESSKDNKENTNKIEEKSASKMDEFENYYVLIGTSKTNILKDGKPAEYTVGNFVNNNDELVDVIVPPGFKKELEECELGTVVELNLSKAGDKTFTTDIKFIQKQKKNVAA